MLPQVDETNKFKKSSNIEKSIIDTLNLSYSSTSIPIKKE
jgi:hypothetical protein